MKKKMTLEEFRKEFSTVAPLAARLVKSEPDLSPERLEPHPDAGGRASIPARIDGATDGVPVVEDTAGAADGCIRNDQPARKSQL